MQQWEVREAASEQRETTEYSMATHKSDVIVEHIRIRPAPAPALNSILPLISMLLPPETNALDHMHYDLLEVGAKLCANALTMQDVVRGDTSEILCRVRVVYTLAMLS